MANREELVHAMISVFRDGIIGSMTEQREDFKGMDAALSVAVGELLQFPTQEEANAAAPSISDHSTGVGTYQWYARNFLESRRSRYLKPKSVEEQMLDILDQVGRHELAPSNALRLIRQLKEQPK